MSNFLQNISVIKYFLFIVLLSVISSCKQSEIDPIIDIKVPDDKTEPSKEETVKSCELIMVDYETIATESPGSLIYGASLSFTKDTTVIVHDISHTFQFTYDSDGFLINSKTSRFGVLDPKKTVTSSETEYIYQNEKLINQASYYEETKTEELIFEYDDNGELVKKITKSVGLFSSAITTTIQTFQYGKQTSFIYLYSNGETSDVSQNYNSEGYLIEDRFNSNKKYFYDDDGNLSRFESISSVDGKLELYKEYEYGSESKQNSAKVHFKGHPIIPSFWGSEKNILIEERQFERRRNTEDTFDLMNKTHYDYTFNASGLITEQIKHILTFYEIGPWDRKISYQYTYQNCP
ncbi:DUF2963 domain-containing protein [Arcticibacterium luteifluviistationis]|uniref:Uncharacterized protein n=1 Tax=Arcticibacterium luteifluviistationis TaxID=1784714 RepID=A0A2Z4GBP9_9BACT|nr:DUF2963 domain-containing protein [Arcticibacterium luteifluviistationis]AWV98722.1 hypothetical protein DJ013_11275 [Arcticibacterium luteifluviistationis]